MRLHAHRNIHYNTADGIEVWSIDRPAIDVNEVADETTALLRQVVWLVVNLSTKAADEQVSFFGADGVRLSLPARLHPDIHIHVTKTENLPLDRYVAQSIHMWRSLKNSGKGERPASFDPRILC